MKYKRVNQLIGKDLRRTGYDIIRKIIEVIIYLYSNKDENGTAVVIAQTDYEQNNSCVLFFYDLDGTGCALQPIKEVLVYKKTRMMRKN